MKSRSRSWACAVRFRVSAASSDLNRMPLSPLGRALARAYAAKNDDELADALMSLRAEEARFALSHGIEGSSNGWQ
jgi:hypothetical protein